MKKIDKLVEIQEKYQPVKDKADRLLDKGQDIIYQGRMMDYEQGKLSEAMASATQIRGMIKIGHGVLTESLMHRKVKKELINLGLYQENEIALDINEFLAMEGTAKAIMSSIDYRANIPKDYLKNLELVWSDASFFALDDASYISNLRYVIGSLSVRSIDMAADVEYVGGKTTSLDKDIEEQTRKVYVK